MILSLWLRRLVRQAGETMKIALLSNPNKDGGYECSKKVAEYLFDKNKSGGK